jgi:hypoxanthine phosphoribosyltransferase
MALGPSNRYVHSAYQVCDLDAIAAGGEYLRESGYHRSWGIGRHIQGSQLFDYWRDPDGFLVEHFADGDMFNNTLEPGWAPFTASGLAQWGPPATKDFLGIAPYRPGQGGVAQLTKDLGDDIRGASVVLVEDIVDTGLTVHYVSRLLMAHEPASFEICTLLDKPHRRIADVPLAHTGFVMPDDFLVGYGLDVGGRYRNLPYIAEVEKAD